MSNLFRDRIARSRPISPFIRDRFRPDKFCRNRDFTLPKPGNHKQPKMKLKLTALLLSSSLLFGQEEGQPDEVPQLDPLVVESSPLNPSVSEATQAWTVLSGDELEKAKGATIAETLSETPGVSQTGFGPTANRPIIRGMDKFRVRILQNGTDTFGVSAQSEDHAVPIDPLMVDRIEVLARCFRSFARWQRHRRGGQRDRP